jgi:hypothetical protein
LERPESHHWLAELFYQAEGISASSSVISQALVTLEALARQQADPASQEILDRMAANDAIAREAGEVGSGQRSQADRLVDLALKQGVYLFHDQTSEPYAALPLAHREIWPMGSKPVRRWLARILWQEENKAASGETTATAINLLSSMAIFDGPEHRLHIRVAWHEEALWYDLGDWRAVRISPEGWEVVPEPPILFRHYEHQLAQTEPRPGGDFHKFFDFLSPTRSNDDTILLGTAILAALVPGSPRPALSMAGPQGSGKTTTAKFIKRIADPSRATSIRRIADYRELQLQLQQNWLLNIDNVTNLSPEISDALAAAITGDSDLRRQLFTDQDLLVLDYMRPMVLNGITHAAQRPDLLDRTLLIPLERIPEERRREEEELWPEFEAVLPSILGSAFDVLSKALAIRPTVRLATHPRMADFAAWGYAIAEAAGWSGPAFLAAYERNIKQQSEEAIAAAVVAQVVLVFMEQRDQWQGQASKLKPELDEVAVSQGVDPKDRRSGWPQDPARLSRELRRLAETLGAAGVEVTFPSQGHHRSIRFQKLAKTTVGTVGSVGSGTGITDSKRISTDGKEAPDDGRNSPVQTHTDGADGTDGNNRGISEWWTEEL